MKPLARVMASIIVIPLLVFYRCGSLLFGKNRAFQSASQHLAFLPGIPGEFLRYAFYRQTILSMGRDVCISFGTIFSTSEIVIGDRVSIGAYGVIGHARIGANTQIASRVSIVSGKRQHGFESIDIPIRDQPGVFQTMEIGEDCWIGEGAIIAANVGEHSVVGAGSIVLSAVEPNSIVSGNPAQLQRSR